MKNIGDTLKKLREENGMTRKEAADKLKSLGIDISDKTLYGYESGRNSANADMFLSLCKIYKCNNIMETFSDTVEDILFTNNEWEMIEKYRGLDFHGKEMVDFTLLKEWERSKEFSKKTDDIKVEPTELSAEIVSMRIINYYYRVASAGTGQIIFDMPPTKRIEIPNTPEYRKVDYAIGVNGTSMEPLYHDGDMLLVEMRDDIEVGEIGIFRINGESFVKKRGETELISLNPDAKNIPLNESAGCMGKVIGKLPDD
ncbi:MAG: XRE family transcriptional regulator [Lachnospiraceae bacterium]